MDLRCDIRLSNWTGIDIESYEPENSIMVLAIFPDKHTFHKSHVGLKGQWVDEA